MLLKGCLTRQLESIRNAEGEKSRSGALEAEIKKMEDDSSRLIWQDGLPNALRASVIPYRERLDRVFCAATAGLEMEGNARRALWVAIE